MRSLAVKLTLAFVAVTLISVAVVAYVSGRVTVEQFDFYVSQGGQVRAEAAVVAFAEHYARTESWEGVEAVVEAWASQNLIGQGRQSQGRGQGQGSAGSRRLLLASPDRIVLADSAGELAGTQLSEEVLSRGSPVIVAGQQVGTLVVTTGDPLSGLGDLEEQYLSSVRRALIWAGVLAGALGIGLGGVLAYQIIGPVRKLRSAAAAIAAGDLSQRVRVTSPDEIGDLGSAFNHMATELERQEALRRNLVADVAHELRTPLSVVRGSLEAMLDGVHPMDEAHVAPVYEETLLLQRLVDDLRLLSLADAGQLGLERRPVNVGDLVEGVLEAASAAAHEANVTLEHRVARGLPQVMGDEQRLRQVFNNLIDNALRHTPHGGWIEMSVSEENGEIETVVMDTGPGIAPGDLAHVFERFYRGERSGLRRSGGTGLGLSISRKLVEAHGGRIWAESPPGEGARFIVRLPVSQSLPPD